MLLSMHSTYLSFSEKNGKHKDRNTHGQTILISCLCPICLFFNSIFNIYKKSFLDDSIHKHMQKIKDIMMLHHNLEVCVSFFGTASTKWYRTYIHACNNKNKVFFNIFKKSLKKEQLTI